MGNCRVVTLGIVRCAFVLVLMSCGVPPTPAAVPTRNLASALPAAATAPIDVTIFPNLDQAHESGFQLLAGFPPFAVDFFAQVTGGSGKPTHQWDFDGNGSVDSIEIDPPPFKYAQPGEYIARLVVQDASGQTVSTQQRIVVVGKPFFPKWKYGVVAELSAPNLYKNDGEIERAAQMIKDVGIQVARVDWNWQLVQPGKSIYNWDRLDSIVRLSQRYGFGLLAVLDYTSEWASTGRTGPGTTGQDWVMYPPVATEYAWYAYASVDRFKSSVHAWEVWNEPNLTQFWMPKPDAIQYTNLLKQSYLAIKYADPSAVVVLGGLCICSVPTGSVSADSFLQVVYAQGGKPYFDAMGAHPYIPPRLGTSALLKNIDVVRNVMLANADGDKPMWVTETGLYVAPSEGVTEDSQAQWLAPNFDTIFSRPYVPVVMWFNFKNRGTDPNAKEPNYGLTKSDWTIKPVYTAYKEYIAKHH